MTSHTSITAIAATFIAGLAVISTTAGADARGLRTGGNVASASAGANVGTVRRLSPAVTGTRAPQAVGNWRYQRRGCHHHSCQ